MTIQSDTVTISIGRHGQGWDDPLGMPELRWSRFRTAVRTLLLAHDLTLFVDAALSFGSWTYTDGQEVVEESATFVAGGILGPLSRASIMADLGNLAEEYGQEAIACTFGVTSMVTAPVPDEVSA